MDFKERLEALEASHVLLMTEHELAVRENDKFWEQNRQAWAEHQQWLKGYDARCENDRLARADLANRITDLVSGIGEFMRREKR